MSAHPSTPGRALVTGASGALGRALAARLQAAGSHVTAFSRRPSDLAGCAAVGGDVIDAPWERLVEGCRAVFHLAAYVHRAVLDPRDIQTVHAVNHAATRALAVACRQSGARLVFASTVAVLGPGGEGLGDDAQPAPVTEYGRSKALAEEAIVSEGRAGLRYAILRFPLLYGEHGRGNVEQMLRAIARRRYWPIGDPLTRKSCLHFDDAAAALALAGGSGLPGGTYVVAPAEAPTLGAIHQAAYAAMRRRVPPFTIPAGPALLAASAVDAACAAVGRRAGAKGRVETLTRPAWYDGSRFAALAAFAPRVSLAEGLARTARWLDEAEPG